MSPSPLDRHHEFTRLLEPLLDAAYRLAVHLSRNAADAEDIVQEASLLAFRHFARFEIGTNFKAWYFRILVNRFYSRYRRQAATVGVEEIVHGRAPDSASEGGCYSRIEDPSAMLLARIESEAITAAIARLPEDFRAVCSLYLVQDLSYREIAEMLAVPVGTVRSRLHRGRRILQQELRHLAAERGMIPVGPSAEGDDDAGH